MKYEHIIWDWNGTLLDDVSLSVQVFNSMTQKYKLPPIDLDFYKNNFRFPVIDFYKDVGFDFDKLDFKEVGEFFIAAYNSRRFECSVFEGAKKLLEELKKRGVGQSILSAYRKDYLLESVRKYNLEYFLDEISGLDDIFANSKEQLGKKHVEKLRVQKNKILMVGDTDHDLQVAKAMGVNCALVENGHFSGSRLRKLDAPSFANYEDLSDFILSE